MDPDKILKGKKILIVDDEEDLIDSLIDLLDMCEIDTASSFEKGKELLEQNQYDTAILDIMGVNGYELLDISRKRKIPALMLTAHAVSACDLKTSVKRGASYYVPKNEIARINIFLGDIFDALQSKQNVWLKWYDRLSTFSEKRFGPEWKDNIEEFRDSIIKY
jgi:CheY-like chemotaxis protein